MKITDGNKTDKEIADDEDKIYSEFGKAVYQILFDEQTTGISDTYNKIYEKAIDTSRELGLGW